MNTPTVISFGPFVLDQAARLLLKAGQPVRIGGRALDLLMALLERPGEVLSREELVSRVWPRTIVEETSLRVHMSALRRVLGDGSEGSRYIANVPGRGYSFIGALGVAQDLPTEASPAASDDTGSAGASAHRPTGHNLPPLLTSPIGRASAVDALCHQLTVRRTVSIVGPGGMGKTTVAIATAQASMEHFPDGIRFIDLSPVSDPSRVAGTLATALGIPLPAHDDDEHLIEVLRPLRMLLLMDNCEHVIDAAADLVHALVASTTGVTILATSREPLNIPGEWVHRLPPLELPPPDATDARSAPAVQLFLERACALDDSFALSPQTAPLVAHLCHQLDGMPLAIELAAARVDTLGIHELVNRLSDMFRVLARGRRTAAPRHQTLQALLDWSHDLLTEKDRIVLRRLSVFRAMFSLEWAAEVVACDAIDTASAQDSLLSLVSKSLVTTDHALGTLRYRMLSTTRTYALSKLMGSGEWSTVSRRHAQCLCTRLAIVNAELEAAVPPQAQKLLDYNALLLDDLRGALDWTATPQGDARLGVLVAIDASRLVTQLGLVDEFAPRMQVALQQAASLDPPEPMLEFRMLIVVCGYRALTLQHEAEHQQVFSRLMQLADSSGQAADRIVSFYSMMCHAMGTGDYPAVADLAQRVIDLSEGPDDPARVLLGERMLAQSWHAMGMHQQAKAAASRVLAHSRDSIHFQYIGNIPPSVSMRVVQARIAWITGEVDDAVELADQALAIADGMNPFVTNHVLALAAMPIALWRGDAERAARLTRQLRETANRHCHAYWSSWARVGEAALALRAGHAPADLPQAPFTAKEADLASTFTTRLVTGGAIQRARAGLVGWCAPETLRADTENRLAEQALSAEEAESALLSALHMARRHAAHSWSLRITISLARLWGQQGRSDQARVLLERSLAALAQGAGTTDQVQARSLLDTLPRPLPTDTGDAPRSASIDRAHERFT